MPPWSPPCGEVGVFPVCAAIRHLQVAATDEQRISPAGHGGWLSRMMAAGTRTGNRCCPVRWLATIGAASACESEALSGVDLGGGLGHTSPAGGHAIRFPLLAPDSTRRCVRQPGSSHGCRADGRWQVGGKRSSGAQFRSCASQVCPLRRSPCVPRFSACTTSTGCLDRRLPIAPLSALLVRMSHSPSR